MNEINQIDELLLRDGMRVDVRGQLVRRNDEPVVTGYRMLRPKPGQRAQLRWEQTPFVRIAGAREAADQYEHLLGKTVFGTGIWSSSEVFLESLDADDSWAKPVSKEPYTRDISPVTDHVRTVEGSLFASGAMLRRVRLLDEEGPRIIVVATDTERVRTELSTIYGDNLEVLESRWSASEIRSLDDVINDLPDTRVLKVEYRMNYEGVISRKVRVDYVDDELVEALGRFPNEMLVVEAVVEPSGMPQERDVYLPPRVRAPSV